jgi:hypothetical protein
MGLVYSATLAGAAYFVIWMLYLAIHEDRQKNRETKRELHQKKFSFLLPKKGE